MKSKVPHDHRAIINEGEENEMEIFGYRISIAWIVLCVIGYCISGGILLLLFYWKPEWSVWANCVSSSLEKANVVLLRTTDERKKYTRKKVRWITLEQYKDLLNGSNCSVLADENSIVNRAIRRPDLKVKFIRVQKIRYVWDNFKKEFQKIGTLEEGHSCYSIHSKYGPGLGEEEQDMRRIVCGHNTIEVEVAPLWKLLINKVLNLFYVYQFFTVVLWLAEGYLGYAIAILLLCVCTITLSLMELRQQSSKLHNLVKAHNNMKVTVSRKGKECSQIESRHLVPGDIIILSGKNFFMSCDAILINGTCVVNEGMLTGECIPVTKTQLPHADDTMSWMQYSGEDYKRHVLFCGTDVIRTESTAQGPAKAVVLRTGFNTTKGDMVRSILYPKPLNFKLHRDVKWFFIFLGFLAVVGIVYAIIIFVQRQVSAWRIIVECLVLLTSAICPIIPAALTVGILYAQSRLKKKRIFCISPARINMCGQLNLFCFDKTGTLTEDGLDLMGIIPSGGTCFQAMLKHDQMHELSWGPLFGAMTSCHSLIMVDGNLQGDPLDLKMFEATSWALEDTGTCDKDGSSTQNMIVRPQAESYNKTVAGVNVLFQYPFSSGMQRMAVITEVIGGNGDLTVYMKGAPEMVASFCKPNTVPKEFADELEIYTFQGLRVIGVAYKILRNANKDDLESIEREEVERDMEFLGLLILENRLKPETKGVLETLNAANIRTVMITGDNIQTATTVAKNCSMIPDRSQVILVETSEPKDCSPASVTWKLLEYPQTGQNTKTLQDISIDVDDVLDTKKQRSDYHFSMSGKTYENLEKHFPDLLPKILMNGTVFARMSPGQKSTIIDEFRKLDYYVGMCGDGANDCAALKMANAGISLSVQEASVAAPFNSLVTNIECVPELLKEGRAALVTSFCMFKYMSMFGLIEYINTLLLYWQRNIFGNNQFLVHDFAIMFVIFLTMSSTPGYDKLAPYRPPGQLVSPSMLLSVVYHVLFTIAMQTYAFLIIQEQPWYSRYDVYSACYPQNGSININLTDILINKRTKKNYESFENSTLWLLTAVHLVILALVLSKGKPFRKPLYTNYIFVATLVVEFALTLFFIFANFKNMYVVLELVCTPTSWRIHMLIMLVICLVVSYVVEEFFLDNRALWLAVKRCLKFKPGSNYKKLRAVLEEDTQWPPVGETVYEKSKLANGDTEMYTNQAYEHEEVISNGKNGIHVNH